jgi:hypothetical protein
LLQAPEPPEHEVEPVFDERPRRSSTSYRVLSWLGIATIAVVGGVFWLALGAFVSAWQGAVDAFNTAGVDRTEHFLAPAPASASPADVIRIRPTLAPTLTATPRPNPTAQPSPTARASLEPTPQASPTTQPTAQASPQPTAQPTPQASALPTAQATPAERPPWVLLPQPAPGAHVASGPLVLEARGRGDVPISEMRLELDGAALPVEMEQRSEAIWRAAANVQVASGRHSVKAFVVDAEGRTGSYGWSFDAGD